MKQGFLERLKSGALLFDGGIGTEIYSRGIYINICYEALNLSQEHLVRQIHEDYKKAGAEVLSTNTYGANRFKLENYGLQDKLYEINKKGAELANQVADGDVFVAGSVGPLPIMVEPLGKISLEEAENYYREQIQGLVDGGVDLLIFETFIYPNVLQAAIQAAKSISNLPIIAQMTIDDDGFSLTGASPEIMIDQLSKLDVDVIGINCTTGPNVMLQWLEKAKTLTSKPISIMPNAGKPRNIEGRNIYLTSPDYLGEYAKHYIQSGASIIGGCCGTSPQHIEKMRTMRDTILPKLKKQKIKITEHREIENVKVVEVKEKSRLARRLHDGHFVKFVELLAPRGVDASLEISKAKEMHYYGIDAINIPDGPRASARMSAMAMAVQMQREIGIETVLHFVCRDRNVIGIQSDLMGAYSMGLKNILAITGDPPKLGNYPDATAVFDVDAIGLVNILNRLNHGMDIAGTPIGNPTGFFVGVGANPGALNLEHELDRLKWKIEAGAEYIVTQPVFDIAVFENFINKIHSYRVPVLAGLWPLVSLRNAEFMNNEVPGVVIPNSVIERMRSKSNSKELGQKEGIDIAKELLEKLMPMIQGVQISAPFGRVEAVVQVLEGFDV